MASSFPFPAIQVGADETYTDPSYYFENTERNAPTALVIQRTLAGEAFYREGHHTQTVPEGHAMVFTHSEDSSYGYPEGASVPYRLRFLAFDGTGLDKLFTQLRYDFGSVIRMPDDCEATVLFNEASARYHERTFRDRLHQSELLYRLLVALYREQVHGTRTSDPIEFGFHLLQNHYRSPINLKEISAKCGISREHFIRRFSARYGESPGAMLRRLRLEHARTMLVGTRLSVEDVALASGFTSSNTFCRAYRIKHGVSPGANRH